MLTLTSYSTLPVKAMIVKPEQEGNVQAYHYEPAYHCLKYNIIALKTMTWGIFQGKVDGCKKALSNS